MADLARLLCAFGHHAAAPGERWNHGYGFTRCRHCGRDLVRSLIDDWQVPPRGFRIAWRPVPLRLPAPPTTPAAPQAAPAPPQPIAVEPARPAAAARDFMDEPMPQPSRRPNPPRPAAFDDFMSDAPPPARSTGTNGRP